MREPVAEPSTVRLLPRWGRYPIPWFVHVDKEGVPDFRVLGPGKWVDAINKRLCWVCGQKLFPMQHSFLIGPMCMINQITSEPPSHDACARYAAKACPFMSDPEAVRRERNMPENRIEPGGIHVTANPGVGVVWRTDEAGWRVFEAAKGEPGQLIHLRREPREVTAWSRGRRATTQELVQCLRVGMRRLKQVSIDHDEPMEVIELGLRRTFQRLERQYRDLPAVDNFLAVTELCEIVGGASASRGLAEASG